MMRPLLSKSDQREQTLDISTTTQRAPYQNMSTTSKRKASDDATNSTIRGRPRKTADAEAVEKRRTQLRVAQRAFRQRREATIDELREQVASIQAKNDDLLATLRGFAERAVLKGLSDELSIDLLGILQKYSDADDANVDIAPSASPPTEDQNRRENRIIRTRQSQALDSQSATSQDDVRSNNATQSNGSEPLVRKLHHNNQISGAQLETTGTMTRQASARASHTIPLYPSPMEGFDGTSFANRLRRRILEAGYQ